MASFRLDGDFETEVPIDLPALAQGETCTIPWTVANLPVGVSATQYVWRVKTLERDADADAVLTKDLTADLVVSVGQITNDGAVTRIAAGSISVTAGESAALSLGRKIHNAFVYCSDGQCREVAVGVLPIVTGSGGSGGGGGGGVPVASGLEWLPSLDGTSPRVLNALNVNGSRRFCFSSGGSSSGVVAKETFGRENGEWVEAHTRNHAKITATSERELSVPNNRAPAVTSYTEDVAGPLRHSIAQVMRVPAYDATLDLLPTFFGTYKSEDQWNNTHPLRHYWQVAIAAHDAQSVGKKVKLSCYITASAMATRYFESPFVTLGAIGVWQWITLGPYDGTGLNFPAQFHTALQFPMSSSDRPLAVRLWNLIHQFGTPTLAPEFLYSPMPGFGAGIVDGGTPSFAPGANPQIHPVHGWWNAGQGSDAITYSDEFATWSLGGGCTRLGSTVLVLRPDLPEFDAVLNQNPPAYCDLFHFTATGYVYKLPLSFPNIDAVTDCAGDEIDIQVAWYAAPGYATPAQITVNLMTSGFVAIEGPKVATYAARDEWGISRFRFKVPTSQHATQFYLDVGVAAADFVGPSQRIAIARAQGRRSPFTGKRNAFGLEQPIFGRTRALSSLDGQMRPTLGPPGCYLTRTKGVAMFRFRMGYWNPAVATDFPSTDYAAPAEVKKQLIDCGPPATSFEAFEVGWRTESGAGAPFWSINMASDGGVTWNVKKLLSGISAAFTPLSTHWCAVRWDKAAGGILDYCIDGTWYTDGITVLSAEMDNNWDYSVTSVADNLWLLQDRDLDCCAQVWLKAVRLERNVLLSRAQVEAVAATHATLVP